jgi:hypothetical protein
MKVKKLMDIAAYQISVRWNRIAKFFGSFKKGRHQLTSTTSYGRYPEVFIELKKNLGEPSHQKNTVILSYGCSTGEECFTLRDYFPHAIIIGADISKLNLLTARSRNDDNRIKFIYSEESNIKKYGKYDAICCFSVLCRWNDTEFVEDSSEIYPFTRFDETVGFLASQLKPGGFLVIYNSNFRFEDASAFSDFVSIHTSAIPNSGFVHKFNRDNKKIYEQHYEVIYQKKIKQSEK